MPFGCFALFLDNQLSLSHDADAHRSKNNFRLLRIAFRFRDLQRAMWRTTCRYRLLFRAACALLLAENSSAIGFPQTRAKALLRDWPPMLVAPPLHLWEAPVPCRTLNIGDFSEKKHSSLVPPIPQKE